jgi:hypothetical protein
MRKKSGLPKEERMVDPLSLQKYSRVSQLLCEHCNADASEQSLAKLSIDIQKFMEVKPCSSQFFSLLIWTID